MPHQAQGRVYPLIREHVQERRLFQIDCQRLLERVVEYRVTRLVVEIGKNDGVLLGQALALLMRTVVKPARHK